MDSRVKKIFDWLEINNFLCFQDVAEFFSALNSSNNLFAIFQLEQIKLKGRGSKYYVWKIEIITKYINDNDDQHQVIVDNLVDYIYNLGFVDANNINHPWKLIAKVEENKKYKEKLDAFVTDVSFTLLGRC